ncbi:MAG: ParB/RepB/Spo0J family partition protein [Pseudomonadota bacterium]
MAGKRRLGRGLDALLGAEARPDTTAPQGGQLLQEVPVEWVKPGKYQPRKAMDETSLQELAASIRAQGVMQPIVLRSVGEQRYEIIAGERRWRAAQLAGLEKVPAVIREVDDEAAIAMSLIENIQREDLNPMEEAHALQRLIQEFELTHQQVADAVGKSRAAVTNFLRLINLAPAVARMLGNGDIEMGHARALLGLPDDQQAVAAREIAARSLNVRQAEALVRSLAAGKKEKAPARRVDADTRTLEQRISSRLGQPVQIQHSAKGKGKLVINYSSLDELDGILSHFGDLD